MYSVSHLVHRVLQLPHHIGVVRLQLSVLDRVKGLPQSVIGLVQGVSTHAVAHQDHHPLQIGDVVDLSAQIIIHQVIVDALDAADVLRQDQGAQAPLPDAAVQVGPGHCPLRVGPGILGLLRVSRDLLDSPILGPGLPCVVLPRLCGQGGKAQRTG